MTNSPYIRFILAKKALEFEPPLIRETLLEDKSFREAYGFILDGPLSFGDPDVSIKRSELFNAVRQSLPNTADQEVTDSENRTWKLQNSVDDSGLLSFTLTRDEINVMLPNLSVLSPDCSVRLRFLEVISTDVNLPESELARWYLLLKDRALDDDEFETFHNDFRDTPVEKARSIHDEIVGGNILISSLIPSSHKYFDRLVGAYNGSISIHDYSSSNGRKLFSQLAMWRPYDGFLFSLLLSSHASMSAEISVDQLSNDDLVRAYDFLDKHGDRISQLGAIEVGLRVLPSRPEIEPYLIRLIEQIRDDDHDGQKSGFKLLSTLFILVDGELSRTRLLSTAPPFYRRLASLTQAALIYRQFVDSAVDINGFCEWAFNYSSEQFYMQSLADMRLEPRWNPDLAVASQMKADFFGRIMIAAKSHEQNIKDGPLSDLVLSSKPGSIHFLSNPYLSFLPGPLEGTDDLRNVLPTQFTKLVETQLDVEKVEPSSFVALVNSAMFFSIGTEQAELAAKVLKLGRYRLANVVDRSQLFALVNGLATVAAVARSHVLADELRVLVRVYRHDTQNSLSIDEAMRICLVSAASCANLDDWQVCVGDWLTELAFSDLDNNEGDVFYSRLKHLCNAVPELWISCGRADAALCAYNSSR